MRGSSSTTRMVVTASIVRIRNSTEGSPPPVPVFLKTDGLGICRWRGRGLAVRSLVPFPHPLVDRGRNAALPAAVAVAPVTAAVAPATVPPAAAEPRDAKEHEQQEQDEQEPEETEESEAIEMRTVVVIRGRRRRSGGQLRGCARRPAGLVSDGADCREQDARQRHPQKTETASHCRYSFVTSGLMPLILRRGCECDVKQRRARYGGSET